MTKIEEKKSSILDKQVKNRLSELIDLKKDTKSKFGLKKSESTKSTSVKNEIKPKT